MLLQPVRTIAIGPQGVKWKWIGNTVLLLQCQIQSEPSLMVPGRSYIGTFFYISITEWFPEQVFSISWDAPNQSVITCHLYRKVQSLPVFVCEKKSWIGVWISNKYWKLSWAVFPYLDDTLKYKYRPFQILLFMKNQQPGSEKSDLNVVVHILAVQTHVIFYFSLLHICNFI